MMAGNFPVPPKDGNIKGVGAKGTENSLNNNGFGSVFNYTSFHSQDILADIAGHPEGTYLGEIQNRLHFHRGNPKNYDHRRAIAHDCVLLTVFGYLRYDGKTRRYYPGRKMLEPATHQERVFDSHGMPRVQPTSHATMPGYGRPDGGASE